MKTQFTVDKEFIKEAYNSACPDWKAKLKNKFPQAFESELEVKKWYKHNKFLLYIIDETHWYGFDVCGAWNDYVIYEHLIIDKSLVPATEKEVQTALTNEFFSKVKVGNTVKCLNGVAVDIEGKNTVFEKSTNTLLLEDTYRRFEIFKDGKFAEIISEPIELTLEEIAEKFNVNVEQLKIKK